MIKENDDRSLIHVWVPNLFDFKGGIQVYLGDLLQALVKLRAQGRIPARKNIDIVVFDKLDTGKTNRHLAFDNVDFWFGGSWSRGIQTIVFAWRVLRDSLRHRPRLILCGHVNFAPVARLIHYLSGIPYWVFVYGVDAWDMDDFLRQRALLKADKIISISNYTRQRLLAEQSLRPQDVVLLPVSFDIDRFQPQLKPSYLSDRYGLQPSQPIILTVARLATEDRHKGYDQILKALPQIRSHIPDVHYILVGKGQDRPRIERLIQELGLQACVTLTGFVPDEEICDYYNLCDVFAMPSKGEGFGIVYLEALACGKPTVGGNQDGAIDALCNGELGILVDPDNLDEIADTLITILRGESVHPIVYRPEILRQKVEEIYGFEQFQANLLALIETSALAAQ